MGHPPADGPGGARELVAADLLASSGRPVGSPAREPRLYAGSSCSRARHPWLMPLGPLAAREPEMPELDQRSWLANPGLRPVREALFSWLFASHSSICPRIQMYEVGFASKIPGMDYDLANTGPMCSAREQRGALGLANAHRHEENPRFRTWACGSRADHSAPAREIGILGGAREHMPSKAESRAHVRMSREQELTGSSSRTPAHRTWARELANMGYDRGLSHVARELPIAYRVASLQLDRASRAREQAGRYRLANNSLRAGLASRSRPRLFANSAARSSSRASYMAPCSRAVGNVGSRARDAPPGISARELQPYGSHGGPSSRTIHAAPGSRASPLKIWPREHMALPYGVPRAVMPS